MDARSPAPSTPPDTEKPEKYVRTFASDMQVFKGEGGSVSDAVFPAKPALSTFPERPVAVPPVTPAPAPAPIPAPIKPLQPAAPPPRAPEPSLAPIKTYAGDFSQQMKETHASTASMIAAEQDSRAARVPQAIPEQPSKGNLPYIIVGVMLFVAGIAGISIAYVHYMTGLTPVAPVSIASAPIFVDERQQISGQGSLLLRAVVQAVAQPLAPNTVRLLSVADTSAGNVLAALPLSAPDILLRNVIGDGSMVGVISVGGVQSPFFILSVSSYSDTFSGMLSWEPKMLNNLSALFPAYPAAPPPAVSTSSPKATATTTTPAARPGFRDEVIDNHDVRVYRDEAGRSVLLYGYWNQTTLVIARGRGAFSEILQRLATAHTQ